MASWALFGGGARLLAAASKALIGGAAWPLSAAEHGSYWWALSAVAPIGARLLSAAGAAIGGGARLLSAAGPGSYQATLRLSMEAGHGAHRRQARLRSSDQWRSGEHGPIGQKSAAISAAERGPHQTTVRLVSRAERCGQRSSYLGRTQAECNSHQTTQERLLSGQSAAPVGAERGSYRRRSAALISSGAPLVFAAECGLHSW